MTIPFNRPAFLGKEREYIESALERRHLSSDGHFTLRTHEILESITGCARALVTTSCTDALEMAGLLLRLTPEDEVIVPTYTFVSTANAFALRGARIRFVDSRDDTLNLDERLLEDAITSRTKAICVVHYAGISCEMDTIQQIASKHGIPVVEDNAHGLFGSYRGRPLGSMGAMSTLSFHETKNISCGEGGALCINDESLIRRAEIIRLKGTNRARFLRGDVDKYTWVDIGSSFSLSELSAAVLCAQLESAEVIQRRRKALWERYAALLEEVCSDYPLRLPTIPDDVESAYHLFHLIFPSESERNAFLTYAQNRGVLSVFHYIPLHSSEMGTSLGYRIGDFPIAEQNAARLARLPFFTTMSEDEQDRVIDVVRGFIERQTG